MTSTTAEVTQRDQPATEGVRPPGTEVTTSLRELVTWQTAIEWLHEDVNMCNRKIKMEQVNTDARDMVEGRWDEDLGDPIRFDWNGKMRDGQHRLASVVKARTAIHFTVIRGLDPASIKNVDVGSPRKFYDVLTMEGQGNNKDLATITRRAYPWEKGHRLGKGGNMPKPSHGELLSFLADNHELRFSATRGKDINRSRRERLLVASTAGFAYWLTAKVDYDDAEAFWGGFMSAANLPLDSPILTLRARLVSASHLRQRLRAEENLALVIRAWNFYRAKETAERLQITRGGLTDSNFPVPK